MRKKKRRKFLENSTPRTKHRKRKLAKERKAIDMPTDLKIAPTENGNRDKKKV